MAFVPMPVGHGELIAFPLLALAAVVLVAVAIVGGELIRHFVVHRVMSWLGLAHADLDDVAPPAAAKASTNPGLVGRAGAGPRPPPG